MDPLFRQRAGECDIVLQLVLQFRENPTDQPRCRSPTSGQTIIFVVSLIEYNQVMFEDQRSNRLHDSLQLFATIVRYIRWKVNNILHEFCRPTDL
jgi:hypothetical protein